MRADRGSSRKTAGSAGFSLVEVLVAATFLGLVIVATMMLGSHASQSSMDAYLEVVAYEVAREPIAIFRQFGADWVRRNYLEGGSPPPLYRAGRIDIAAIDPDARRYPGEAQNLTREIQVTMAADGAVRVVVSVGPRPQTRAQAMLRAGRGVEVRALLLPVSGP